jgi:hypothetical protein
LLPLSRGRARARHRNGGKAKTVVANVPEDLKGILKLIGGSKSDWNIVLADQTSLTLWLKHSGKESKRSPDPYDYGRVGWHRTEK